MSCGRMYLLQRVSSVDTKLQEEHSNCCKGDDVCLMTAWRLPLRANARSGLMVSAVTNFSQAKRLVTFPKQCVYFLSLTHWKNRIHASDFRTSTSLKFSSTVIANNRHKFQFFFHLYWASTYWTILLKKFHWDTASNIWSDGITST